MTLYTLTAWSLALATPLAYTHETWYPPGETDGLASCMLRAHAEQLCRELQRLDWSATDPAWGAEVEP